MNDVQKAKMKHELKIKFRRQTHTHETFPIKYIIQINGR